MFAGSPAQTAGVRVGDLIVEIDGEATNGLSIVEVAEKMRGPIGTSVRLGLLADGVTRYRDVWRDRVIEPTVFFEPSGRAAYIRISAFNVGTTKDLRAGLIEARKTIGPDLAGVILDLRQNRGGNLNQAIEVSDLFVDSGVILQTTGRSARSNNRYRARETGTISNLPMVVLIDGGSASASEIVASALQDAGRALVVGTRSFGKGTIQDIVDLPNNTDLIFTTARMHAPSGYGLSTFGVFPSVCTSDSYNGLVDEPADIDDRLPDSGIEIEQIASNEALRKRRQAETLDSAAKADLRSYCNGDHPPANNDSDVRVARLLLESRDLHERVSDASRLAFGVVPIN